MRDKEMAASLPKDPTADDSIPSRESTTETSELLPSEPVPAIRQSVTGDFGLAAWPPPLSDNDRKILEAASAIRPEVIAARGYFTLQNKHDLARIGHKVANGKIPCLVVPLHSTDGETVYQIRPHTAPVDANGKAHKYLLPGSARLVVDCHPLARADVMNPDVELWLTEGAKKADASISRGLPCLSISGVDCWQQNKTPLPEWFQIPLKERRVILAFDSDWEKPSVYFALRRLSLFLKSRGADVRFAYLPDKEDGKKVGLDDFFAAGHTVAELRATVEETLRPLRKNGIEVNSRQLRDMSRDAMNALLAVNDPPRLFVRGGHLVRVELDERNAARIELLNTAALRGELARATDWVSTSERRGVVDVVPPLCIVEDLLALPEYDDIPALQGLVTAPVFAADGSLSTEPGYHPPSQTFLHLAEPFRLCLAEPTDEVVQSAVSLLTKELLIDFPFADAASRAHTLAYTLQPFVRPMISGPTPVFLFDAPKAGTGKTLLALVTSGIFTGGTSTATAPATNEEWGKFLIAILLRGNSHLLLDNVRNLTAEKFFAAVSSTTYTDRILGVSEDVSLPVRLTWAATCNNVSGTDELTRRAVWIRLDSGVENPDERREFKHPDILAWASKRRGKLINACLTIVRYWLKQGRPHYSDKNPPMGMFEAWTRVMGGILESAGIDGFLDNRGELKQRSDNDSESWRGFVTAWYDQHVGKAVPAADLFSLAQVWLPEKLGDGTDRSQRCKLGKLLMANRDKIYAGKKIVKTGTAASGDHKGQALYSLQEAISPGYMGEFGYIPQPQQGSIQDSEREQHTHSNRGEAYTTVTPYTPSILPLILCATLTQRQCAEAAAMLRKTGNDRTRKPTQDGGSDAENLSRDKYGALGEILVRQWLESNGVEVTSTLVDNQAVRQPDLMLRGLKVEVKSCRPSSDRLTINKRQHDTRQPVPDYYLPVLFVDETTAHIMRPVPHSDVDGWAVGTGRNGSVFYYRDRKSLSPVTAGELLSVALTDDEDGPEVEV